ncbi:MAG: hypothetical protein SGI92_11320, partial [Bryobacteraceae bacterium]|nr:hypothetical protein [Bryobacteraceae bacterium]
MARLFGVSEPVIRGLLDGVAPFLAVGFNEHQLLGVILAIGVKILSNYSNHVFHTPVGAAFAAFACPKPASDSCATTGVVCHSQRSKVWSNIFRPDR